MLVAERQQKIVEIVNMRSSIRVSELSDIFSVTEETIRRDLEKLEKEHKLSRSHGGAVSIQQKESEIHFSEREITNVIEKKAIAHEAAKYVKAETESFSMQAQPLGTWRKYSLTLSSP